MTFAGFLLTALNFVMLSYYDNDFLASTDDDRYQPIPNWFWIFASINIFLAYTLGEFLVTFLSIFYRSHESRWLQTELTENKREELDYRDLWENFSTTAWILTRLAWFQFVFIRCLVEARIIPWNLCGFTTFCWWFCSTFMWAIGRNTTRACFTCHGWDS